MSEAWLCKEPTERYEVTRLKRDVRAHDVVGDGMSRRPGEWNRRGLSRCVRGAAGVRARIVPQRLRRREKCEKREKKAAQPEEGG